MSLRSNLRKLFEVSRLLISNPRSSLAVLGQLPNILKSDPQLSLKLLSQLSNIRRGFNYSGRWDSISNINTRTYNHQTGYEDKTSDFSSNPLKEFFDSRESGRGIWKWVHYFDVYHRHFSKFVGREVNVLEIGVYSGGSLEMWREYFGSNCRIYGVDLEEACKCYENEYTEIIIGDQGDRDFWESFKRRVPAIDILIDDGGHLPEQQIVTLEEMLPHLRPGGVYLCEDVHGEHNGFTDFMHGLASNLNVFRREATESGIMPTEFQAWIESIHFYPYVTVIKKADEPLRQFIAPKHGTEWQPFLD